MRPRMTPLAAVGKGLLAGAVGTGVMTAAQMAYYKASGRESSSVPGEVARRIVEGVLRRDVPDERLPLLNNAMHWAYGTAWGAAYGVVAGSGRAGVLRGGTGLGLAAWGASLVHLPAMGLAPPVWRFPPASIATDVGFHLVYGLGVSGAFGVLASRG